MSFIWQTVLITIVGTLLLRLSGRRSISQMTVAQTVIMISIGTILIQPISGNSVWKTLATAFILVASLLLLEMLQVKFNLLEKFISGQALPVIENGVLNERNLRKMRMTVDRLEMRLRQANISNIEDVQWATIEPSGQLGYQLMEEKQPVTKADLQQLVQLVNTKLANIEQAPPRQSGKTDLFTEVVQQKNTPEPPKHLQ